MSGTHHQHGDDQHDHAHVHPTQPDGDDRLSYYQVMEVALRELLIEKRHLTSEEVRAAVETMDARSPAAGARVVARAWTDAAYKARLLADGSAACKELGIDIGPTRLVVVENTADVHNMIVCTLCSCYPRNLLGLPPDWYKSRAYRSRAVYEPRTVLAEFGTEIPDDVTLRVHDSTADMRYLVLPMRPAGTTGLGEAALAALVTRDSMIGVTRPKPPAG
ncbi:MAG TPA: nitrile hydratase subunit alpha [Candidatus Sulfotelmatobacter sp.]|nr:nitrile hydratase subunit alpha [Candidatus Sulfotelmatobacter sp.]